jgi:hypothetical protein
MARLDRDNPFYDYIPANPTAQKKTPTAVTPAPVIEEDVSAKAKLISTYTDPVTGDIVDVYSDNTEKIRKQGTKVADAAVEAELVAAGQQAERQSAYDLLYSQFNQYGLGGLVEDIKGLIGENVPASELSIRLTQTPAYQQRFSANQARISSGLRALTPAEYVGLEDQYQNVMRNYGLPASYYTKDSTGKQPGFDKFLAGDVSATELEDRIMTAQNRVINANPEVANALKQFYPDISNGDILAYTLDPTQGLEAIKRKVTAAEIGGAALQAGLQTGLTRAEELRAAGITKEEAQQGFGTIAGGLQRGSELAAIYGESPYTQTTAESEIFKIAGAQEARKQRQKIAGLEEATFGGQTGITQGALARDRAGAY